MKRLTKTELKAKGFICTDGSDSTEQWVKKIDDKHFEVYERHADKMNEICMDDYTEDEIKEYTSGYYYTLEDINEMYGKDANMIIAECISEQI